MGRWSESQKTLNQEWDGRKMGSFLRTVVESLNREKSVDLLTAAEQLQRQLSTDLVKKLSERVRMTLHLTLLVCLFLWRWECLTILARHTVPPLFFLSLWAFQISKRVMASMENALRQEDFGQQSSLDATVDREFQKAGDEYERMVWMPEIAKNEIPF